VIDARPDVLGRRGDRGTCRVSSVNGHRPEERGRNPPRAWWCDHGVRVLEPVDGSVFLGVVTSVPEMSTPGTDCGPPTVSATRARGRERNLARECPGTDGELSSRTDMKLQCSTSIPAAAGTRHRVVESTISLRARLTASPTWRAPDARARPLFAPLADTMP